MRGRERPITSEHAAQTHERAQDAGGADGARPLRVSDVAIDDFLASLGLAGEDAARGRAVLEAASITNPRKTRISTEKLERAKAAITGELARFCRDCSTRADAGGRGIVVVAAASCERCGGSRNERALAEAAGACTSGGIRRLVVVGGSPDTRRELSLLGDALELRLIDGTARRTGAEAQRDLDWADLVVIAGSSELGHKVSNLYTRERTAPPVITAPRRGVEAIAGAIVEHVRRRG
jgi:hypothetical protein